MAMTAQKDTAEMGHFSKALELLHKSDWAKAAKGFEKVVAETDSLHLRDRARQMLAICENRLAKDVDIEDPYLRAVFAKNSGHYDEALAMVEKAGTSDERFAFLAASIQALRGENEGALEHLDNAIRLEPKNRVHAYHDPDFESLRELEEFTSLVASS